MAERTRRRRTETRLADLLGALDSQPLQEWPEIRIRLPAARDPRGLVEAWLKGRSQRTREAYASDLEDFRAFIGA